MLQVPPLPLKKGGSLCGGGVPSSHPSLGLSVSFFLCLFFFFYQSQQKQTPSLVLSFHANLLDCGNPQSPWRCCRQLQLCQWAAHSHRHVTSGMCGRHVASKSPTLTKWRNLSAITSSSSQPGPSARASHPATVSALGQAWRA